MCCHVLFTFIHWNTLRTFLNNYYHFYFANTTKLSSSISSSRLGLGLYELFTYAATCYITEHTHLFNGPFLGLPGWAGTRKVKPIWILLKQETVSGSAISWAICKSAPRSRQITTPAPHHSVFYRPDALPVAQPTASKHWKQIQLKTHFQN